MFTNIIAMAAVDKVDVAEFLISSTHHGTMYRLLILKYDKTAQHISHIIILAHDDILPQIVEISAGRFLPDGGKTVFPW